MLILIHINRLICINGFLVNTKKQREVFEVQFSNWCGKWEKVAQREKKVILVYELKHGQTWEI